MINSRCQGGNETTMVKAREKSGILYRGIFIIILSIGIMLTSACSSDESGIDPKAWHYDCQVFYNALGGVVNSREIRETYYMKNSYLYEPAGSSNMLIQPIKDGYLLAGWYTAKEDITDGNGNVIGYSFKAEDRWDFDEDRVQGDMTLYARWIQQGKVEYIDSASGEVMFTKNITGDSPIQKLSSAAEKLIAKDNYTFAGYYQDKECTIPYDFSIYTHSELIPSDEEIYAQLFEEFPEYFKKVQYVEPDEDEMDSLRDTSDLYLWRLGYEITTNDPEVRNQIRKRKDEIIENAIVQYEKNTADKVIYLKYIEGNYIRISSPESIKTAGKYAFTETDASGKTVDGYILENDIDFKGITVEMAEKFSGKIYGNGYKLKNIEVKLLSKKLDQDTSKIGGLFASLDKAYIENVVFENLTISVSVRAGIPVTVGALAVNANDTTLKNVKFDGLTINTGTGDDGNTEYKIFDLFANQRNIKLENVKGSNVTINASETAQVKLLIPTED